MNIWLVQENQDKIKWQKLKNKVEIAQKNIQYLNHRNWDGEEGHVTSLRWKNKEEKILNKKGVGIS